MFSPIARLAAAVLSVLALTSACGGNAVSPTPIPTLAPGPSAPAVPPASAGLPPPTLLAVSPSSGSTSGGDPLIRITGTGFQAGAQVTIGDAALGSFLVDAGTLAGFGLPPHTAGAVDVTVQNPDGRSVTLVGGYSYVSPDSLDFNGRWNGYAGSHRSIPLTFVIQDNQLTYFSCGGAEAPVTPGIAVRAGQFSLIDDRGTLSGRIVSPLVANGAVSTASCSATTWVAEKQ